MVHESKSPLSPTMLATTPRTPTLSKRPAPTLEHSEERVLSIERSDEHQDYSETLSTSTKDTTSLTDGFNSLTLHQKNEITVDKDNINNNNNSDNNNQIVNASSIECNSSSNNNGLREERRKSFKANMRELALRLEDVPQLEITSNNNCNKETKIADIVTNVDNSDRNVDTIRDRLQMGDDENKALIDDNQYRSVWSKGDNPAKTISNINTPFKDSTSSIAPTTGMKLTRVASYRNIARANGMQTMPVSRLVQYKFDKPSVFTPSSTRHQNYIFHQENSESRDNYHSESIFKFRRVFILDDSEDNVSPPPSINGSLSSENSSMSDSNSDSISEMSIDSSSDRSSVISLDDSFDFVYNKNLSHSRHYSSCYNVWEEVKTQSTSSGVTSRFCPRECSGSIARALSKFTSSSHNINDFKEGSFYRQRKSLTIFNSSAGVSSKLSSASKILSTGSNKKCVGLELTREKNSNVVVIREVKAVHGSKFPRCSEVKCESVQSRIRRLQIQNGLQTELAKRFDIF